MADRVLEPYTDIAIAVSKSTADFVISARLMPASQVKVVYLGVPLEEFSRAPDRRGDCRGARRSSASRPDEFAIGTVTRLHDSKGNSYLVDAAARVVHAASARPVLPGRRGAAAAPICRRRRRALGLGDRFVFAGFRRDVAGTLSAFDLSVFPSLWEGTPFTAFEALAMGKPIVATDADGLLDILTDGRDALIVPKRDADALAAKIVWADRSARPSGRGSGGAPASPARQYDIGAFVRKMERLYVCCTTSRGPPPRGCPAGGPVVPDRRESRA